MRQVGAILLALFISTNAAADVLASCGGSTGIAYFLPGGVVPPAQAGFMNDQISEGGFLLIRNGDEFDVIYTDASGGTKSARGEGAIVIGSPGGKNRMQVLVAYPDGTTESFVFQSAGTEGIAVWTQAKANDTISKGALYVSNCDFAN